MSDRGVVHLTEYDLSLPATLGYSRTVEQFAALSEALAAGRLLSNEVKPIAWVKFGRGRIIRGREVDSIVVDRS